MANVLSRLGAIGEAIMTDRRKVARSPVRADVNVTTSNGAESKAIIADLSTHGCCLHKIDSSVRMGSFIAISLQSGRPLQAIVRWVRDDTVGVEFLRPIPGNYAEWHTLIDSMQGF